MRPRVNSAPIKVSLPDFGWDAHAISTLRHSTLPWLDSVSREIELAAVPLAAITVGARDAMSLLAQYAAHFAFLRLAERPLTPFDASEFAVIQKRGADPRLVRISAKETAADFGVLESLQAFARHVGAPDLAAFERSWIRPENVFHEIHRRLRADVKADRTWLLRSATGAILSPGIEALSEVAGRPAVLSFDGPDESLIALQQLSSDITIIGGEATPLRSYSALKPLAVPEGSAAPSVVAEQIAQALGSERRIIAIQSLSAFDARSREAIAILSTMTPQVSWIVPTTAADLISSNLDRIDAAPGHLFVLGTRLSSAADLAQALAQLPFERQLEWARTFAGSEAFDAYLDDGVVPSVAGADGIRSLVEPKRSYLAVISLLGTNVDLGLARDFLTSIGLHADIESLATPGVCSVQEGKLCFTDREISRRLRDDLPPDSRSSLRIAAAKQLAQLDAIAAAELLDEAGEWEQAAHVLESVRWQERSSQEIVSILGRASAGVRRSSRLAATYARALFDLGRYEDAAAVAPLLDEDDSALLLSLVDRRVGAYKAALARLKSVAKPGFEHHLLAGELERLAGNFAAAAGHLEISRTLASDDAMRRRCAYEAAVLAIDSHQDISAAAVATLSEGSSFEASRLDLYRATSLGNAADAILQAEQALSLAGNVPERIDAALDLVYALFIAGEWESARHEARAALTVVEETQGDRAATGLLFTLAFLCADSGLWEEAQRLTARSRAFFERRGDERRLAELSLLDAQCAFTKLSLDQACRLAAGVPPTASADIREAAALIIDESDWIRGTKEVAREFNAECLELKHRRALQNARVFGYGVLPDAAFSRLLGEWEAAIVSGRKTEPPVARTRSEELQLLRSAHGLHRRLGSRDLELLARSIANRFQIRLEAAPATVPSAELELLQSLAAAEFPFRSEQLGSRSWRFVTRNRIGRWSEAGSLPALPFTDLDRLFESTPSDWMRSDDASFFYIEGLGGMSSESQRAIAALVRTKAEHARLRRLIENEAEPARSRASLPGLIGECPQMLDVQKMILRIEQSDHGVCVEGESGTGKEVVARAIHLTSRRKSKKFVAVNCAALPETLVESELFGAVRGAFTGAERDRVGLIESADGGTLFLDEIGELPLIAQAKLLRFMQEKEYRRVGDTVNRTADVRIVCATNRRLEQAVDEGLFREDLYWRVKVVAIALPPLRERGKDVLLLARHFLAAERSAAGAGPQRFSDDVESLFLSYEWPGNVRELQNTIRGAFAMSASAREIELQHLPDRLRQTEPKRLRHGTLSDEIKNFHRSLLERALAESNGNQSQAAKRLGISRQALAYQIRELGILVKR